MSATLDRSSLRLVSTDEIEAVARFTAVRDVDTRADLVAAVQREGQRIAPTLFSAWESDDLPITTTMRAAIRQAEERTKRYRDLQAALLERHPVVPIKGLALADLYPAGVARQMNDLDLVVDEVDTAWHVASDLIDVGFETDALTLQRIDGQTHMVASFRKPLGQFEWDDRAEIMTLPIFGDLAGLRPTRLPTYLAAHHNSLLLLLEERHQRSFIARDLVDATVLIRAADSPLQPFWGAVDELGLWPEWMDLAGLLERCLGLADLLPEDSDQRVRTAKRLRLRRSLPSLSGARSDIGRTFTRLAFSTSRPASLNPLINYAQSSIGVVRAWRMGMPLFGALISSEAHTEWRLVSAGSARVALALTPIGMFAMSISSVMAERDIEQIAAAVSMSDQSSAATKAR